MLGPMRILAIAAVRGSPGGLDIGGFPGLGTQGTKKSMGGKGAGADFEVVRLHDKATLPCPIVVQFLY